MKAWTNIIRFCTKQLGRAHVLFAVLALIAGICLVQLVPPFWGTDENNHFDRTYQISTGQVRPVKQPDGSYGGRVPSNAQALFAYVDADVRQNDNIFSPGAGTGEEHDVHNHAAYAAFTNQPLGKQLVSVSFPATSAYSPVAYTAPAAGVVVGRVFNLSLGHVLLLGRLTTLLVYIVLVYGALWLLKESKAKWIIFSIALLPNCIIQASIISPDPQLFGLALLLFALFLRAYKAAQPIGWLQTSGIAAVAALLPLTKPVYFPFVLLVLLLPATLWRSRRDAWFIRIGIVACSAILLLGWTYATRDVAKAVPLIEGPAIAAQVDTHRQTQHVLHHLPTFFGTLERTALVQDAFFTTGMVGSLSWNVALIPTWLGFLAGLLLVMTILYQDPLSALRRDRLFRLAGLVLGLCTVLAVFVVFYITYTPVASPVVIGVQGRYFIPALAFIAYGLCGALPVKATIRKAPALFGTMAAFILLETVLFYHRVLY